MSSQSIPKLGLGLSLALVSALVVGGDSAIRRTALLPKAQFSQSNEPTTKLSTSQISLNQAEPTPEFDQPLDSRSVPLQSTPQTKAINPKCEGANGVYKNRNGDIATVTWEPKSMFGQRVRFYLKQHNYQRSLTFVYFNAQGHGTATSDSRTGLPRSIYYVELDGWKVAVFGELAPFWYNMAGRYRASVPTSLWFQVSCLGSVFNDSVADREAAKTLSVPMLKN